MLSRHVTVCMYVCVGHRHKVENLLRSRPRFICSHPHTEGNGSSEVFIHTYINIMQIQIHMDFYLPIPLTLTSCMIQVFITNIYIQEIKQPYELIHRVPVYEEDIKYKWKWDESKGGCSSCTLPHTYIKHTYNNTIYGSKQ